MKFDTMSASRTTYLLHRNITGRGEDKKMVWWNGWGKRVRRKGPFDRKDEGISFLGLTLLLQLTVSSLTKQLQL